MSEHLLSKSTSYQSSPASSSEPLNHPLCFRQRKGLWHFLKKNIFTSVALVVGVSCVVSVTLFTTWLSKQIPACPSWSIQCEVPPRAEKMFRNIGRVQGLVTALYSIGLASLAFFAHSFSESALWPILNRQRLSLEQMDTYLGASRGSIPASPQAIFAARSLNSIGILFLTTLVTLIPLSSGPIVGQVYNMHEISMPFKSHVRAGGGSGPFWRQRNPPLSLREASSSFYSSWQYNSTYPVFVFDLPSATMYFFRCIS